MTRTATLAADAESGPTQPPVVVHTNQRRMEMEKMFRIVIATACLLLMMVPGLAIAANLLDQPESVEYDAEKQRYLVSNWANGNIIQVDLDGNQTYFDTSLVSTAGLHIRGNTLYAASNYGPLQGLVLYDLVGDSMLMRVPISGLGLINDITTDDAGWVYATEFDNNSIYKIRPADSTVSSFVSSGLWLPNGILYDGPGNRLLVSSIYGGNNILAVDLDDSSHTIVATTGPSGADGITRDIVGNYYYSLWSTSSVYRYDSAFSQTAVRVSSGHSAPADIFFNKHLLELAVPNFNGNRLDRVPMLLEIGADVTCGCMPLLVEFEGLSELSAVAWIWDFGDGDSAFIQNPNHSYEASGRYNVGLAVITAGGDTLTRHAPNFIGVLADSLWPDDIVAYPDSTIIVTIYAANDTTLNELIIPVEFSGELALDPYTVTWSTLGCRSEAFELQQLHSNPAGKEMTLRLTSPGGEGDLSPGTGPVLRINFELSGIAMGGQTTSIALDGYESYSPGFGTDCGQHEPTVVNGSVTSVICCEGSRGNVDGDPGDITDISDLVYLVDFMFVYGSLPPCFEEGDVDGNGVIPIDIADLVYLVDYMFSGGPIPPPCL